MSSEVERGSGERRGRRLGWRDASGKASLRGLIALLVLAAGVYAGMKLIPVRAAAFRFADAVRDQVTFAASRRASNERIRDALLARAKDLGLPITATDIKITRPSSRYLIVEVSYTVPIEFVGGYVFEWPFSPRAEGPLI